MDLYCFMFGIWKSLPGSRGWRWAAAWELLLLAVGLSGTTMSLLLPSRCRDMAGFLLHAH